MEVLKNETIDKQINGFLGYCNIDSSNLNNKQKLSILQEKKMAIEMDLDIVYDNATNTTDIIEQEKCIARVEADERVISELNICINYLIRIVRDERKISLKRKELKFLNIGLLQKVKTIFNKNRN